MKVWTCIFCGQSHDSPSGTGVDVSCCGEVGHVKETAYAPYGPHEYLEVEKTDDGKSFMLWNWTDGRLSDSMEISRLGLIKLRELINEALGELQ